MNNSNFLQTMQTAIEELVDQAVNRKLEELKANLDADVQKKKDQEDEYISIDELSSITGLSKQTIYGKRSRRQLPGTYKFGRELRFNREEILEWMKSKKLLTIEERRVK